MTANQPNYEITIKQGDLFIELSSDDVYFISKQMDKWFQILLDDRYIPVNRFKAPEPPAPPPVIAAPEPTPPPIASTPVEPAPVVEPPVVAPEPVVEPVATAVPEPTFEPKPAIQMPFETPPAPAVASAPEAQAFLQATQEPAIAPINPPANIHLPGEPATPVATPPPVINQPVMEQQAPPVMASPLSAAMNTTADPGLEHQDDFEKIMDSLMEDLGETDLPPEPNPVPPPPPVAQAPILEPMPELAPEPQSSLPPVSPLPATNGNHLGNIQSLDGLCQYLNASTPDEILLLSAYYLTRFDSMEKFSLKRLNATIVQSGLSPINHSVLETSLSRGLLQMVPDLTGLAEVSEYAITPQGKQVVESLI